MFFDIATNLVARCIYGREGGALTMTTMTKPTRMTTTKMTRMTTTLTRLTAGDERCVGQPVVGVSPMLLDAFLAGGVGLIPTTTFFDITTNLWSDAFLAGRGGDFDNVDSDKNNNDNKKKLQLNS